MLKQEKKNKITAIFQMHMACKQAKNDSLIGPTFGQYGIKGIDFCKKFNEVTDKINIQEGTLLKTIVCIYEDRSFLFTLKTPPLFYLLTVAESEKIQNLLSIRDLYKIIKIKKQDVYYLNELTMFRNLSHTLNTFNYEVQ